jgi:peptidoglycan/LPS O-acetylase OafA/YrhL
VWAASSNRASALLLNPALVLIGMCSYSLYLLHVPVQLLFLRFLPALSEHLWFTVLVMSPVAVAAAVITRLGIERPAQLWIRKTWAAHQRTARMDAIAPQMPER